jgi:D-alanine--poly(phosphoribitol) ligase subunit 2
MTEPGAVARVQALFEEALRIPAPAPDVDIIEQGLLDSLALVTLLFEFEVEFGVQIPLDSLEIDDFRTIERLARLAAPDPQGPPGP